MKKLLVILAAFCVACVLFLQPLKLVSDTQIRLTLHPGKDVPLYAISDMAGGFRCYVNENEYFWLSMSDCVIQKDDHLHARFRLKGETILYRR